MESEGRTWMPRIAPHTQEQEDEQLRRMWRREGEEEGRGEVERPRSGEGSSLSQAAWGPI